MSLFEIRKLVYLIGFICWTGGAILSQDQSDEQNSKEFKITGQVLDKLGKPIVGATASLQMEHDDKCISVVTNDSGNFEILCDAKGRKRWELYLWVYAKGYNLKCVRPLMESNQRFLPCEVKLNDEDCIDLLVVNSIGKACPNAFVEPCHFDVPNGVYYSDQSTGLVSIVPKDVSGAFRARTDKAGKAELRGIPIGKIKSAYCSTGGVIPQLFRFKGNASLSLELRPTGTVRGRVVCKGNSVPRTELAGRKASLVAYEKPRANANNGVNPFAEEDLFHRVQCYRKFELDENGCFELEGVLAGEVALELDMGNSEFHPIPKRRESLDDDGVLDLEIEIEKGVLVKGKMLTSDTHQPMNSVRVSFYTTGKGATSRRYTESDEDGNFRIYLHPGEYTVQPFDMIESKLAKDYSYAESTKVSVLSQMESCNVPDLLFPPIQRQSGKLIDANGKALPNRRVALIPADSNHPIKYGVSDDQGKLDIRFDGRRDNSPKQNTRWVIYPKNSKSVDGDIRQYPTLAVDEESPLVLKLLTKD